MPLGAIGPSRDCRPQVHNKVLGFSLVPATCLLGRSEGAVTEHRLQRRLAAILAADVVGYASLMQRAEEATYAEFERLKRHFIEPSLARHDGRLIKTTGDGALAEFASPSAAVRCAVEIQESIASGRSSLKLRLADHRPPRAGRRQLYLDCWLIDRTYAVACHISSSVSTSRQAGIRRPLFSRPSAIDWKMPLGSSWRSVRLMPPLPSTP